MLHNKNKNNNNNRNSSNSSSKQFGEPGWWSLFIGKNILLKIEIGWNITSFLFEIFRFFHCCFRLFRFWSFQFFLFIWWNSYIIISFHRIDASRVWWVNFKKNEMVLLGRYTREDADLSSLRYIQHFMAEPKREIYLASTTYVL